MIPELKCLGCGSSLDLRDITLAYPERCGLCVSRYQREKATLTPEARTPNAVDHPQHYGGEDNVYEAIKVIEAWQLGFCLGNAVKYIARAGKKDKARTVEDLEKAAWYLAREIARLKGP